MREHGIAERVILIHERAAGLLEGNERFDAGLVGESACIVMRVIHGKHEVEEEKVLFPVVKRAPEAGGLVEVLRRQHAKGRALTALIGANVTRERLQQRDEVRRLIAALRSFGSMYRAHAAYENTLIYPVFRESRDVGEYRAASAQLRADEREIGEADDAHAICARLDHIEQALGLSLAHHTSRLDVGR